MSDERCRWYTQCGGKGKPCGEAEQEHPESDNCACGHIINCCAIYDTKTGKWDTGEKTYA